MNAKRTYRFGLERLDRLDVLTDVVCYGLESFQNVSVVREVDRCLRRLELVVHPLGLGVSFSESLQGGNGF
jgi:hypothetical protein